jgi:hypothetical protein
VHCSVAEEGHGHHQQTGYIDPTLVEQLYADLVRVGARFDALILFWLGEPLLHPHFGGIWRGALRAAAQHGVFGKVEVHTNATHLSPARVQLALNAAAVPQVWHFSLDAIDAATYRRVKGMDRHDKVQGQVEHFLREKARLGARWPRPVFQYIVGSNNAGGVRAFRDHWLGLCLRLGLPVTCAAGHVPSGEEAVVFFRQKDCPTAEEQEAENALFRREMAGLGLPLPAEAAHGEVVVAENAKPCSGFWKSPVISWRGEVTSCTRDNLLQNRVGDLREGPFSQLWWGARQAGRRARVARGDYRGLPLCQTCFIPRSLNHSGLSADDIVRQAQHDARCGGSA